MVINPGTVFTSTKIRFSAYFVSLLHEQTDHFLRRRLRVLQPYRAVCSGSRKKRGNSVLCFAKCIHPRVFQEAGNRRNRFVDLLFLGHPKIEQTLNSGIESHELPVFSMEPGEDRLDCSGGDSRRDLFLYCQTENAPGGKLLCTSYPGAESTFSVVKSGRTVFFK